MLKQFSCADIKPRSGGERKAEMKHLNGKHGAPYLVVFFALRKTRRRAQRQATESFNRYAARACVSRRGTSRSPFKLLGPVGNKTAPS